MIFYLFIMEKSIKKKRLYRITPNIMFIFLLPHVNDYDALNILIISSQYMKKEIHFFLYLFFRKKYDAFY